MDLAHGRARAEELVVGGRGGRAADGGARATQSAGQHRAHFLTADGFREMIEGAELHRLDGVGAVGVSGQDDDREIAPVRVVSPQPAQGFQAVHPAHPQVQEHGVRPGAVLRVQ